MSDYEYGPLLAYEITWQSGHIETVRAHQVTVPPLISPFMPPKGDDDDARVMFHGEIDGRWQLVLMANADDVRTIRNVTDREPPPARPAPATESGQA